VICWLALSVVLGNVGEHRARAEKTRPGLYVYLHRDITSASLGRSLAEQMPALDVVVFGRYRDFEEAFGERRPDAILALQPLLASYNVPVLLQGRRAGQEWEPYVLLTKEIDGPLGGKHIGVVDLLGRGGTQDFVSKLLGTADIKLKRVTKMEDLLPLLQFAAADAVLIAGAEAPILTRRSRLPLRVRDLPDARVGLPAVGIVNRDVQDLVVRQVQSLDDAAARSIGVDGWGEPR
jgi:hypothetical protein